MAKLYVSNKDESARMFKSDLLEMFTHVHWSVPIIIYLPVVAYSIYASSQIPELQTTGAVSAVRVRVGLLDHHRVHVAPVGVPLRAQKRVGEVSSFHDARRAP